MEQQLEFILRDILDDLKQLRANNIDLQNSLVTLSDQVNTFGKLLKEQKQQSFTIDTKPIEQILNNKFLNLANFIAAQTLGKRIEHKHHLHKGLFISLILTFLSIFLSFGWYNNYNTSKHLKANDIKYRALKVIANKSLLNLLNHTDSLYSLNNDSFEVNVNEGEKLVKTDSISKVKRAAKR